MPDNIKVLAAVGDDTIAPPVATDLVGGQHYQKLKIGWGPDGTWQETSDTDGIRMPVGGAQVGAVDELAPPTDTGPSGLNGRLQRIAQRLTALLASQPAGLTAAGGLPVGPTNSVLTATVTAGLSASNAVDLGGISNVGLIVPSTFDGTQISFQVSDIFAGTYVPLYDIYNSPVQMTVAPSRAYDLPGELTEWRFLKVFCTTTQAGSDTVFTLVGKS